MKTTKVPFNTQWGWQAVRFAVDTEANVKGSAQRSSTPAKGIMPAGGAGFIPEHLFTGFRTSVVVDESNRTRQSVLCVDDAHEARERLSEMITYMGHRGITAKDGMDALNKLAKKHFDIVITNAIIMPPMGGIELIKRIKINFGRVDVIAIAPCEREQKYTNIIAAGASDIIANPFEIDELEARINRVTRERLLRAELERLSSHDGLTGLYNRRCFDENLIHELVRAFRQFYGLYLLLVDIDNFKVYNDRYGHRQGDRLIKELAKILKDNLRTDVDSAYRYGGDEFAVILPHADGHQALMVAERLRTQFNTRSFTPTSLSIGMAKLEGSLESLREDLGDLIEKADQALYLAKGNGGNKVAGGTAEEGPTDLFYRNLALQAPAIGR
jgi:two-component system cell cycle response regulator